MLTWQDHMDIHRLLALYGHIIDDRAWNRMEELFTAQVVFDSSDFGAPVHHGLETLRAAWIAYDRHPVAHHATNIVVIGEEEDGAVRVLSKGLGVGRGGRVGSVTYRDILRRTDGGWRIDERTAVRRRAEDA